MAPAVTQQRATRRLGEVSPGIEEIRAWLDGMAPGSVRSTPISREIVADVETPVSAYLKIAGHTPSFMLESIEGGERLARYSFIGAGPVLIGAVGWLYWKGDPGWATALLVWSILCMSLDNVLRPILIRRGANLPLTLIFAGVPSVIVKITLTRLRSCGVTVVTTSAP